MYDFMSDSLNEESTPKQKSQIKNYYTGKTVLLTGGTGFLGQLFVEKLLRSDIKELYLVARNKKGKTAQQRIEQEFSGVLFSKLKQVKPDYMNRIRIIEGDLKQINVGISENDLNDIYENVNIVLHVAADVRFDEKLANLVLTNLRGTRELLNISERIKNLENFTYISTAFSNSHRDLIEEKFYESPYDPMEIIPYFENLSEDEHSEIEILTDMIIKPWPNAYTFTKCLSEDLVRQYGNKFPVVVIRPTIVISTYEDPIPGWCSNIYGLNGCLVACGMGVLRILPFDRHIVGDVVCADFVINTTLAAIWYTYKNQMELKKTYLMQNEVVKPEIYYVGTAVDNPSLWGEISELTNRECTRYPPHYSLWKQCENDTTSSFLFFYYTLLFHFIPASVTDLILSFTKKKIRFLPIYRKVQKFLIALKFFMQKEFNFTNNNTRKLLDSMSPEDKAFYPSDVKEFSWGSFVHNYVMGLRMFIGHEYPLNHNTRKRYQTFVYLHTIFLALFYGFHFGILWLIAKQFNLFGIFKHSAMETYHFILDSK